MSLQDCVCRKEVTIDIKAWQGDWISYYVRMLQSIENKTKTTSEKGIHKQLLVSLHL